MYADTNIVARNERCWSELVQIVCSVLEETGFQVCQADKGVFSKACDDGNRALACLSTDDVLLFAKCHEVYLQLKQHFMKYFKVTSAEGPLLRYLNMRIVISPQGISIDQTDYIQGILREYGFGPDDDVPKVKGPFPTDPKFEVELFNSLPLDANEHKPYVEKHKGTLAKWTGALMHPQVWTRYDLGYSVMHLSGYMAAPTSASYQALHHVMCYLYHHQHFPIMYPSQEAQG